jgi:hypothetical protein
VWQALQTKHRHFCVSAGEACLLSRCCRPHRCSSRADQETLVCLQMILLAEITPPGSTAEIVPLFAADAPAMVALTDLAFPGFFRQRTCEIGCGTSTSER